jgi:hypothetical protein
MAASTARRPSTTKPATHNRTSMRASGAKSPTPLAPIQLVQPTSMSLARIVSLDGAVATVDVSGRSLKATVDAAVDDAVLETALRRGERVLVEVTADRAVIVGALRTQATPGIERAERFDIQAGEVTIAATRVSVDGDEVALNSKTARLVLRAAGEIESFAERIVSRASGVHKIVGRMLRLN